MNNSSKIDQRFAQLISLLGMSNNAFAKSIGKSSTAINYIVDGKSKPGFDVLESIISQYPTVNTHWLMTGDGEAFQTSSQDYTPKEEELNFFQKNLKTLELNFNRLASQLETKDNQLSTKDQQIAGLQRMLENVLGKPKGANKRPLGNYLGSGQRQIATT